MSSTAHQHSWVRDIERKPYPGSRKMEYIRIVNTCACGAVAKHYWQRKGKA